MSAPRIEVWPVPSGEHAGRPPSCDLWHLGDWLLQKCDGRVYARKDRVDLALRTLKAAGAPISREHAYLAVYVARAIEPARRRPTLAWSLHREVARLSPDEQDRLLEAAEREGWTCAQLREHLRAMREAA